MLIQSKAKTVAAYLEELPEDRREAIAAIRKVILKNLPKGYAEGMQYGMIGYSVPHSVYPAGYHCDPRQPLPFASLAVVGHAVKKVPAKEFVAFYESVVKPPAEGRK